MDTNHEFDVGQPGLVIGLKIRVADVGENDSVSSIETPQQINFGYAETAATVVKYLKWFVKVRWVQRRRPFRNDLLR